MIVDPNTGMPIQQQQEYGLDKVAANALAPGHNTAAGAVSGMAAHMGFMSPDSFFSHVLDTIPSATKTTAWNAYRGTRTIGYGARGVDTATSISSTLNPRYLRSMPSMKAMGGRSVESANRFMKPSKYKAGEAYTPFNSLAPMGNKIISGKYGIANATKNSTGKTALRIQKYSQEGEAFSRGAVSRVSAMSRVSRGSMSTSNIMNFIGETDKSLASAFKSSKAAISPAFASEVTSKEGAHLLAMSAQGSITGRATGYMAAMATGESGVARATASATGNVAYMAGSELAAKHMASIGVERVAKTGAKEGFQFAVKAGGAIEKLGFKAGEKAGLKTVGELALKKGGTKLAAKLGSAMALQAVPVVGQVVGALMLADMVVDIGKLGMEGVKSGIDFAKDAVKSYRGSIDKGVMGMGYRDNTVAATSRQRGVMAIQNSRLNARSVLGSEAGAMHAHFG